MDVFLQLIVNGIIAGGIYALLAVSFSFIYSTTKFFNLAHGSIGVVAAYTVYFLTKQHGVSIWISVPSGIVVAAIVGWLIYRIVYSPLRKRRASSMVLLVSSLGVMIILQSLMAIIFSSNFRTITNQSVARGFEAYGLHFSLLHVIILFTGCFVTCLLFVLYQRTLFGKAVNAVSDDEEVSKIVGINTNRILSRVFLIGSGIGGLGGILFALDTGIQPTSDLDLLLKGVIAAIVGGVGNIYGAVIGAFVLGIVENVGIWIIPAQWKDAIAFGILIVFLLVRPGGILRK